MIRHYAKINIIVEYLWGLREFIMTKKMEVDEHNEES